MFPYTLHVYITIPPPELHKHYQLVLYDRSLHIVSAPTYIRDDITNSVSHEPARFYLCWYIDAHLIVIRR